MFKVVFDTQIFLRALINFKSACGKLVFDKQADYILYTADQIDNEIRDVLKRPKVRTKFPQITDRTIRLVELVLDQAHRLEIKPEDIKSICRDPKDDIFLACARIAEAHYLISEDNDLLVINQYHTTKIMNVTAFLNIIEKPQG